MKDLDLDMIIRIAKPHVSQDTKGLSVTRDIMPAEDTEVNVSFVLLELPLAEFDALNLISLPHCRVEILR